jgi:hypothetical protein
MSRAEPMTTEERATRYVLQNGSGPLTTGAQPKAARTLHHSVARPQNEALQHGLATRPNRSVIQLFGPQHRLHQISPLSSVTHCRRPCSFRRNSTSTLSGALLRSLIHSPSTGRHGRQHQVPRSLVPTFDSAALEGDRSGRAATRSTHRRICRYASGREGAKPTM